MENELADEPTARNGGTRCFWPTSRRSRKAASRTAAGFWRRTPTSGPTWRRSSPATTRWRGSPRPFAPRGRDAQGAYGSTRARTDDSPAGIGELGDFRLLREVGRGGMGVVYEAEQISLRRRVALKVLPFAAAIDAARLQRFKTEALTAAHVQHERIVPVHAVGCERGVHYYAMQFIEGQSLAALIGELRRLRDEQAVAGADWHGEAGVPTRNHTHGGSAGDHPPRRRSRANDLSDSCRYFDRVAGLGRQAALALEHAHQAGIVHRDVKPGNLLLDLRAQLWVTDFGLAQVTGDPGSRSRERCWARSATPARNRSSPGEGSSITAATSIRSGRRSTSC